MARADVPRGCTDAQADALVAFAARLRDGVRRASTRGDDRGAARRLNALLLESGARPQLDRLPGGDGWHVHFHGSDDSLATGWAAGCATGLALALGSDLAGRLGRLRGAAVRPGLRGHLPQRQPPVLLDGLPEPREGGRVPRPAGEVLGRSARLAPWALGRTCGDL